MSWVTCRSSSALDSERASVRSRPPSSLQYSCNATKLVSGLWLTYIAP